MGYNSVADIMGLSLFV